MTQDIDYRAQFVSTLAKDHIFPGGGKVTAGAQVFISIETKWNESTNLSGPMPSPVAIFLNSSITSYKHAIKLRDGFQFEGKEASFTSITTEVFDYIEAFFQSVIFSATSIEAFCNVHIDDNRKYEVNRSKCTELYMGEQIERWINLDDKLCKVVAPSLNATIDKSTTVWTEYKNLIKVRDRLIHMKNKDRTSSTHEEDTVWTLVATENLINPPEIAINLMEKFFENATRPSWFEGVKHKL